MCKSVAEGGTRCDCDSSEKRRFRNKLSAILSDASEVVRVDPSNDEQIMHDMDDIKSAIDDVNEKLDRGPTDGQSQEEFDAEREKEISVIGASILRKVEDEWSDEDRAEWARWSDEKDTAQCARREGDERQSVLREEIEEEADKLQSKLDNAIATGDIDEETLISVRRTLNRKPKPRDYDFFFEKDKAEAQNFADEAKERADNPHAHELIKEAAALSQLYVDHRTEIQELQQKIRENGAAVDYADMKMNVLNGRVRREKTREVLASIRDMGGTPQFDDSAPEDVKRIMEEEVSQNYPSQWIDYHNAGDTVTLVKSEEGDPDFERNGAMAFYAHEILNDKETDGVVKKATARFAFFGVPTGSKQRQIIQSLLSEHGEYSQESMLLNYATDSDGAQLYTYTTREFRKENPHDAQNWVKQPHVYVGINYVMDNKKRSRESQEAYLKRVKKHMDDNPVWILKEQHTLKASPRLNVNANATANTQGKSILTHELGHRMEYVVPDNRLTRMEFAFLKRRKKPGSSKTISWNRTVYENTDISTGFYSSRIYPGLDEASEVFTTGMESVFYNKHDDVDKDHQSFVVGALATLR